MAQKEIHTQAKRQYSLVSIMNRSNVFLGSIVVKRKLESWEVEQPVSDLCMRKQTKMAPKATEQTGVDKKKKSRLLFERLPVRISKGNPATLPEIPCKAPRLIRGNSGILPRFHRRQFLTKPSHSALRGSSRDFKLYCLQHRKKKNRTGTHLQPNQHCKTRRLVKKLQERKCLSEKLGTAGGCCYVPVALCVRFLL